MTATVTVPLDGALYVEGVYSAAYELLAARLGRRPRVRFRRQDEGMVAVVEADVEQVRQALRRATTDPDAVAQEWREAAL